MEGDTNDFEEYVEKYCRSYHYTPDEAKEHALIKHVKDYYEEVAKGGM